MGENKSGTSSTPELRFPVTKSPEGGVQRGEIDVDALAESLSRALVEATNKRQLTTRLKQAADVVFAYFGVRMGRGRRYLIDDRRRKRIVDRLFERLPERTGAGVVTALTEVLYAIDGATMDDWIMGRDQRSKGYRTIKTVLRDNEQVERFMDLVPDAKWEEVHPFITKAVEQWQTTEE